MEVELKISVDSDSPSWLAQELRKVVTRAIAEHAPFYGLSFSCRMEWQQSEVLPDYSVIRVHNGTCWESRFGDSPACQKSEVLADDY